MIRLLLGVGIEAGFGPECATVQASLAAWRSKAAELLLTASAALYLPVFVMLLLGHGPPMALPVRWVGIAVYLIIAAAALFRRVSSRVRLRMVFCGGYLIVLLTNIAIPDGPFGHVGLVTLPVMVLVFFGVRAGRIAILGSAVIFLSAPFLSALHGVERMFAPDTGRVTDPAGLIWMQAILLVAVLAAVMVLLDGSHRFLLDALAAQSRATAEWEREARERTATQREMEHEMEERRRLEREIAGIGDEERRRLGLELHDGVCQQITAALLRCQALERRLDRGGTLIAADFEALSSLLAETVGEAHDVALGLCPLEPDALAPALRALVKRVQDTFSGRCEFLTAGDVRAKGPGDAQHLYRIAQEALSNAVRHASANRIVVELRGSAEELILRVGDDGSGLLAEYSATCMGLRTMAYRAQILGGKLSVAPRPDGGTRVTCRVPRLAGAAATPHQSGEPQWMQSC